MVCSESPSTAAARARASSSSQPFGGRHADHAELAFGQGAGLVEDHHVDLAGLLQRQPVAHQDAVAGAQRGGDGDDQRDRQPQRMGAGDDQHRGHSGDHFHVEAHGDRPGDGGDDSHSQGDVEEPAGGLVGQDLGVGFALLRLLDQPHDAGQGGLVAGGRHPHPQTAVAVDRAGDDLIARAFATGLDSPVIMASLTSDSPSSTSPSAGTLAPGRTSTRSPCCSSLTGTSSVLAVVAECARRCRASVWPARPARRKPGARCASPSSGPAA